MVVKNGALPLIARESIEPRSTMKIASKAVFFASERRSPMRTRARPIRKMRKQRSEIWSMVSSVGLPSGPSRTRKKFWSAFMKTFRPSEVDRAYRDGVEGNKSAATSRFVSLVNQGFNRGGKYGERQQKEIYEEAETQSRTHRGRLRKERRFEEGSRTARLGDREQVRQGRQKKRFGPRKKEEQEIFAQRREERRQKRRKEEALSAR